MDRDVGYKDMNPKDAIGSNKVPMSCVPAVFIAETALGILEGRLKYGQVNWRAAPVRASVYLDAAIRHLAKYSEGEDRDRETGVHHLGNAGACLAILVDAAAHGTLVDDRNFSHQQDVDYIDSLHQNVMHLKNHFKDKNPKHWQLADARVEQINVVEIVEEKEVKSEKVLSAPKRKRVR